MAHQFRKRPAGHHRSAMHARARTQINDVIRAPHRLLIVLDHHHRIAARLSTIAGPQAIVRCRARAGRSSVRPARKARRLDSSQVAPPAGCAAFRRRTTWARPGPFADSPSQLPTRNFNRSLISGRMSRAIIASRPLNLSLWKKLRSVFHRHIGKTVHVGRMLRAYHEAHGAGDGIQPGALAIRADFAFAFLPSIPGFLDGIGARAAVHVRQIKQLAEPTAFGAPTLRRIVAENLRIERFKGAPAFRAGAFGGMHGNLAVIIQREQCSLAQLQRLINQQLRGGFGLRRGFFSSTPTTISTSCSRKRSSRRRSLVR